MKYEEIVNNIKPNVKNVRNNVNETKTVEEELENVEKDIKEYGDLGEFGKSELARAENKKASLISKKKRLENKSKNELDVAKKVIKLSRKDFSDKVDECTKNLNLREETILRCKEQMLELKKIGKTKKYQATNEFVQKTIEEKKEIAKQRTAIIKEYKEVKPKLDNLESLLEVSKLDELEKEMNTVKVVKEEKGAPETELGEDKKGATETELGEDKKGAPETELVEDKEGPETELGEDTKAPETELGEDTKGSETELGEDTKGPETELGEDTKGPETELGEDTKGPETELEEDTKAPKAEKYIEDLLNEIAKIKGKTTEEILLEVTMIALTKGLTVNQLIEDIAQSENIIPKQIKSIQIDEEAYTIDWGHGDNKTIKFIGEKDDEEAEIKLDRRTEAKFKEYILEEFPDSKDCIKKLDMGVIQALYQMGRPDLCEDYMESIRNGDIVENFPELSYDLSEARGIKRNEMALRRNARNNKEIAFVEGASKNPFLNIYDSVRNIGANVVTKLDKFIHKDKWKEEMKQLRESTVLMLAGEKEEEKTGKSPKERNTNVFDVVRTADNIMEDMKTESFRESMYNKRAAELGIKIGREAREESVTETTEPAKETEEVTISDGDVRE